MSPTSGATPRYRLLALEPAQLQALADGGTPSGLPLPCADGALPPPFVAARALRLHAEGQPAPWGTSYLIVDQHGGRLVGGCGFKQAPQAGRVELGYGVAADARGQGAASAAVAELLALAHAAGAAEVLAEVAPDNLASIRVVSSAGFRPGDERLDDEGERVRQWWRTLP